jgi:hypothetical protein
MPSHQPATTGFMTDTGSMVTPQFIPMSMNMPATGDGRNSLAAQQGTLQGLPALTNTASPNVTAGSTFAMPQLSGNQGTIGNQSQPTTPFSNAVANILAGNR